MCVCKREREREEEEERVRGIVSVCARVNEKECRIVCEREHESGNIFQTDV